MSIDLGSQWMKVRGVNVKRLGHVIAHCLSSLRYQVGIVYPGVMDVALNKESQRKTPAVIAFRDDARIFGEDAVTLGLRYPANSFQYLTDLLGKTVDSPVVELYRKRFPYYDIEADPERKTVVFKVGEEKYSVEELVAQLIQKARDFAEETAGQTVNECTLVVPGYFGQAERAAVLTAANLANVKVLQLINDYTAVGLNYGLYKQKEINETAQYYLFYDMGAYKTSAAVVSYQLVRNKATRETLPVIQVLGVGFDRSLGGLEMQLRLRDHLAREFNKQKKTKTDAFTSARAMGKLFKEAGRVKNILSANQDHYAQIEGLLDEKDFKHQVTRDVFEGLCEDLFARATKPLDDALKASGLTLDVIGQVILFGGAVRTPRVQDILKAHIKADLGKNINMDEAAAIGAVYRAADLATGFQVKKIATKDAVLYPIQVTFEREGNSGSPKQVKRNLFTAMSPYPQKKVITFNKNTEDFEFDVSYADLDHLPETEIKNLGETKLMKIKLRDVAKTLAANQGENVESKGIKAHFTLDESCLFSFSGVELVLEKTVAESEDENWNLGSTISKLFSSGDDDASKVSEGEAVDEKPKEATESAEEAKSSEKPANETDAAAAAANKTVELKPKLVTVKQPIPNELEILYTVHLKGDQYETARRKVDALNEKERQILRRDTALNALESFVIDAQQKLDEEEYASCATPEEIEAVRTSCSEVSEWLYEDGADADADTYEKRLTELKAKANEIYARHWEHSERPEATKALRKLLDGANSFLKTAKNLTKDANPDKDVFTAVEIATLEKAIAETKEWLATGEAKQAKLKRHEPIHLTVKSVTDKMALLDREVKYLVSKLKIWRPKVKEAAKKNKTENANETVSEEATAPEELPATPEQADGEQQPADESASGDGDAHIEL